MTTVTWYGHSCIEIESGGYSILVDPFLKDNPVAPIKPEQAHADFILVSHGHSDHVGDTVEIAKRLDALVICNFELANWLSNQGVRTHPQHIGGGYHHPFGYLKLTQALHGSALPDGGYGGNPAGFLLFTADGKKIYLAGDTGLFGDMSLIGEEGIDLAALPIGDNFTMGPLDALKAVKLIHPQIVLPIHYNTWDLISQDVNAWKKQVEKETPTKVAILKPGEKINLS